MTNNSFQNFNEYLNALIKGRNESTDIPISIDDFSKVTQESLNGEDNTFWMRLIDYLNDESLPERLNHYGIRETDFPEDFDSVTEFINNNADLIDEFLKNTEKNNNHWNESVSKLVEYYNKYLNPQEIIEPPIETLNGIIIDSHGAIDSGSSADKITDHGIVKGKKYINFRLDELIYADAGNYFGDDIGNFLYDEDISEKLIWRNSILDTATNLKYILVISNKKAYLQETNDPSFSTAKYIVVDRKTGEYYYLAIENRDVKFVLFNPTVEEKEEYEKSFQQFFIDTTNEKAYRFDVVNGVVRLVEGKNYWVRPRFNINGESYKKVRSFDRLLSILNSKKNLQFTRFKEKEQDYTFIKSNAAEELLEKYLRLIMPKYTRTVEVEDLNRNFWVMAQSISSLFAWLLNLEDPLSNFLKGITDEILQLWENVFYLQVGTSLLSQIKQSDAEEFLYLPITNNEEWDIVKFDDFDNKRFSLQTIWNKYSYLADSHAKSNLIILPEIRQKNYFHNYYSKVTYPGVIYYDNATQTPTFYSFSFKNAQRNDAVIDLSDNTDPLAARIGLVNDKDMVYRIIPMSNSSYAGEQDAGQYKQLVRAIANINKEGDILKGNISFYDVSHSLYVDNPEPIEVWTLTQQGNTINVTTEIKPAQVIEEKRIESADIKKGYYVGELISASYYRLLSWNGTVKSLTQYSNQHFIDDADGGVGILNEIQNKKSMFYLNWIEKCKNDWISSGGKDGTLNVYLLHSGIYDKRDTQSPRSIVEMHPYLTLVYKRENDTTIKTKTFLINVDANDFTKPETIHKNSSGHIMPYPYMSAYTQEGGKWPIRLATTRLGFVSTQNNEALLYKNNVMYVKDINYSPSNSYSIRDISNKTSGMSAVANMWNVTGSLRITWNERGLSISPFVISSVDRAFLYCRSQEQRDRPQPTLEQYVPYLYRCKFISDETDTSLGIINAFVTYNKKAQLQLTNLYGYPWYEQGYNGPATATKSYDPSQSIEGNKNARFSYSMRYINDQIGQKYMNTWGGSYTDNQWIWNERDYYNIPL